MSKFRLLFVLSGWLAYTPVFAQYAPPPGVKDSLLPALVIPWIMLFIGAGISLRIKKKPMRTPTLKIIGWSIFSVAITIALLFATLSLSSGLFHEKVAAVTLYIILLSGPISLTITLTAAALLHIRRRRLPGLYEHSNLTHQE